MADEPLGGAVFRHIGDAKIHGMTGMADAYGFAVQKDVTGVSRREAEHGLRQFAASRTHQTRQADNFSGMQFQADIVRPWPSRKAAQLQHRRADLRFELREEVIDSAAHHHADEIVFARVLDLAGADILAVAQNSHPIGQHEDLVEPVTDVDDGHAALAQQTHQRKETLHVRFGQRGCGFVHDKQTCILRKRLGDFHALAITNAQGAYVARHVDVVDVERKTGFRRPAASSLASRSCRSGARGVAHVDVLGHAQFGIEQELLVNRGDAMRLGVARVAKLDIRAIYLDSAGFRLIHA